MSKRKIRLEEIESFVFEHDVNKDGKFKKGYQVHLGRITRKNGKIVAWACNKEGDIKWTYHFNPFQIDVLPMCQSCLKVILGRCDERTRGLLSALPLPPTTNRGVN